MKRTRLALNGLAPAGVSARGEVKWILISLGASALWSLRGALAIVSEMRELHERLLENRVIAITVFPGIIGTALFGFYLTALVLALLAVWHYVFHRLGARSDYTMRRLPNGLEYHIRCLAIPVLGIIVSLLLALALWWIYRSFYLYMHRWAYSGTAGAY